MKSVFEELDFQMINWRPSIFLLKLSVASSIFKPFNMMECMFEINQLCWNSVSRLV